MASAKANPQVIESYLEKEVASGNVLPESAPLAYIN